MCSPAPRSPSVVSGCSCPIACLGGEGAFPFEGGGSLLRWWPCGEQGFLGGQVEISGLCAPGCGGWNPFRVFKGVYDPSRQKPPEPLPLYLGASSTPILGTVFGGESPDMGFPKVLIVDSQEVAVALMVWKDRPRVGGSDEVAPCSRGADKTPHEKWV